MRPTAKKELLMIKHIVNKTCNDLMFESVEYNVIIEAYAVNKNGNTIVNKKATEFMTEKASAQK